MSEIKDLVAIMVANRIYPEVRVWLEGHCIYAQREDIIEDLISAMRDNYTGFGIAVYLETKCTWGAWGSIDSVLVKILERVGVENGRAQSEIMMDRSF